MGLLLRTPPPPSPEMLAIIGKEICSFPYYFQPESYRSMSCHPSGGKCRICTRSVMYVGGATDAALPNMHVSTRMVNDDS